MYLFRNKIGSNILIHTLSGVFLDVLVQTSSLTEEFCIHEVLKTSLIVEQLEGWTTEQLKFPICHLPEHVIMQTTLEWEL